MVAGQPGGGGRQVVGRGGGEAAFPPALRGQRAAGARPVALEPEHGGAEHSAPGERLAYARFDRAEVLPYDDRTGPVRLQDEDGEHRLGVMADVRALGGRSSLGDPPEPEQAHDVIDAQGAGVGEQAAQQPRYGA